MKHFALLAALSAALPYVSAHGFVGEVVLDGQTYEGNVPNQYKVEGASNKELFFSLNAALTEMVVHANLGSNATFQWSGSAIQKWPAAHHPPALNSESYTLTLSSDLSP
ncbi:hypothetical protein GSI_09343 [Ganoderma sinense ZZ0214-1]|uniref:Glycoside hydrolase 131 catalytic N-terminal domain-containing protein n=1 Tax=Ganoderma sinense ZZ0214-1 TaxID=1077348 RepID=A0A2G8S688_9APHY|nr:hypothetical protein GSI_09343 [Ganoderma sinense ZZ0214-1]